MLKRSPRNIDSVLPDALPSYTAWLCMSTKSQGDSPVAVVAGGCIEPQDIMACSVASVRPGGEN